MAYELTSSELDLRRRCNSTATSTAMVHGEQVGTAERRRLLLSSWRNLWPALAVMLRPGDELLDTNGFSSRVRELRCTLRREYCATRYLRYYSKWLENGASRARATVQDGVAEHRASADGRALQTPRASGASAAALSMSTDTRHNTRGGFVLQH